MRLVQFVRADGSHLSENTTREQSTKFIMKLFDYKQMNDVYYSFHTQDPEWCIKSLLEINNLTENIFDNNMRLKQIIKANGNY